MNEVFLHLERLRAGSGLEEVEDAHVMSSSCSRLELDTALYSKNATRMGCSFKHPSTVRLPRAMFDGAFCGETLQQHAALVQMTGVKSFITSPLIGLKLTGRKEG